ncbi:MAG: 8-amino-7-oxononanoate synthase, partial [Armatimonadetes bacterium]|nr:8-amino-7-oxononanoate synthase [Armatimonadota bacterium]
RRLRIFGGPHEPWIQAEGRRLLLLSSNNYLGLGTHPAVKAAAQEAVARCGVGSGGSRITTGTSEIHVGIERRIARLKRTEGAMVFSSGYMANIGVIPALAEEGDAILSDELNHASLIDGCRLSKASTAVYRHRDMNHLRRLLGETKSYRRRLIVTDGVFSMDGDIAPLPDLLELALKHRALVMVDDAHSTGVLGPKGEGTAGHFGIGHGIDVQMGTLSKALGAEGGYVAGSAELMDFLRNKSRTFVFSTALAPASAAAASAALDIMEKEPGLLDSLRSNGLRLREGLSLLGWRVAPGVTPILPILIGDSRRTVAAALALEELGVLVSPIRPPTVPEGTSRLRATVMATHTPEDLETALAALGEAGRRLGMIP